ncbi:hypothetical protein IWQ62_005648 [Dispira parvispora]|uniref:Uncharacterized protein n=1 Tax=Dispira parvispora TaxID=1520584 RepID=A0A9W8AQK7_9FUNG|nr:hypothetical protein IWQ62_005648 [Dispira parvispora]
MKWILLLGIVPLVNAKGQVWEMIEPKHNDAESTFVWTSEYGNGKPPTSEVRFWDEKVTDNIYIDPQTRQAPYVEFQLGKGEPLLRMTVDTSLSGIYVDADKIDSNAVAKFLSNYLYHKEWRGRFRGARLKTETKTVKISNIEYKNVPVTLVKSISPQPGEFREFMPLDGVIGLGVNHDIEYMDSSFLSILCNNRDELNVEFRLAQNEIEVCMKGDDSRNITWVSTPYPLHRRRETIKGVAIVLSQTESEERYPVVVNPALSKILLPQNMAVKWLRENGILADPWQYTIPVPDQNSAELTLSLPDKQQLTLTHEELVYSLGPHNQYFNIHAEDYGNVNNGPEKIPVVLGRPALKKFSVILQHTSTETRVGFPNPIVKS